jgi:hypothetical protein
MKMRDEQLADEACSKVTTSKGLCILEKTFISQLVVLRLARLYAKGIKAIQQSVAMERIIIVAVFFS